MEKKECVLFVKIFACYTIGIKYHRIKLSLSAGITKIIKIQL